MSGVQLSEREQRFDRFRARFGMIAAPLSALIVLMLPLGGLSGEAHRLLAIGTATVILWITEAIPLAMAALLAPALAVLFDVAPAKQAFAGFAHPLIFLFLGGFMLAEALSHQGFDRRAALWLLAREQVRGSPTRALIGVATVAFGFSMWINNTATTAMMLPIAVGLCASIRRLCPDDPAVLERQRRFEEGMLICLAYASSLGGICTPIGTAPNVIAMGQLERVGEHIDFLTWMSFGVPLGIAAMIAMLVMARIWWPPALERMAGLSDSVRADLDALGPTKPGERRAVLVFGLAIAGWLTPSIVRLALGDEAAATQWAERALPEGVVALVAASLLFLIPSGEPAGSGGRRPALIDWARVGNIDWGTLFLLGGGLALGDLTVETGLADALGGSVEGRFGEASGFVLLAVMTALTIYATELISNTAMTNIMVPVVIPMAIRLGIDPIPVTVCVTLAASFAFMLPVSTPPNALVYGTGLVRIPTMIRFGAWMDIAGLALILALGLIMS
ncbi:SLC13 family permease [Nannocystaceae bacterium ST9]